MSYSEQVRRARKRRRCDDYPPTPACWINPGDLYLRAVAFPDGDVNTSDKPWVLNICGGHDTTGLVEQKRLTTEGAGA